MGQAQPGAKSAGLKSKAEEKLCYASMTHTALAIKLS